MRVFPVLELFILWLIHRTNGPNVHHRALWHMRLAGKHIERYEPGVLVWVEQDQYVLDRSFTF